MQGRTTVNREISLATCAVQLFLGGLHSTCRPVCPCPVTRVTFMSSMWKAGLLPVRRKTLACGNLSATRRNYATCTTRVPSVTYLLRAIFVKPQQWPTPSESIAIYCVRKLVSCVTHLQSCAKVDIWNKKKKLRTVAKIKTKDYKNWRLQNLNTIATPPLNTATTLFNEHRSQRPFGTSDWQSWVLIENYSVFPR